MLFKIFVKKVLTVNAVQMLSIFPPKDLEKYGAQNTHAPCFLKKFLSQLPIASTFSEVYVLEIL